jgi:hypothetical protein
LEHEIFRKSFAISLHGSVQAAGVHAIKHRQIIVEHHLLAANQINAALDLNR